MKKTCGKTYMQICQMSQIIQLFPSYGPFLPISQSPGQIMSTRPNMEGLMLILADFGAELEELFFWSSVLANFQIWIFFRVASACT